MGQRLPRQGEDPSRRRAVPDPRAARTGRSGSAPCSRRSTPPSPTVGRPFPTIRAAETCRKRRSGSAGCRRRSPGEPERQGTQRPVLHADADARLGANVEATLRAAQRTGHEPLGRLAVTRTAETLVRRRAGRLPGRFDSRRRCNGLMSARRGPARPTGRRSVALRRALRSPVAGRRGQPGGRVGQYAAEGRPQALGRRGRREARRFEPYWVARADLSARAGDVEGARKAYALAIGLQTDPAARDFLAARLAALE